MKAFTIKEYIVNELGKQPRHNLYSLADAITDIAEEQDINEDNIEKGVNSFVGVNYGYAFDCINCDSFWILTLLGPYRAVYTTDDGSTYSYSGWYLNVAGGYGWYFENDISVILGIGPSFGTGSKESENLKSDKGYGNDVEDRVKKLSFQPISSTPFFAIGYSF